MLVALGLACTTGGARLLRQPATNLLTYSLTHLLTYSLTYLLTYLLTTTRWCSSPSACYPWCTGRGSPPLSNGCATTACCCSCLPCVRAKPSPDAHPRGRRQLSSEPSTSIVSLTSRPSPLTLTHHLYPRRYPRPRPTPTRRRRFRRLLRASIPRAVGPTEARPVRHRRQPPVVARMCGAGHPYVVRRL